MPDPRRDRAVPAKPCSVCGRTITWRRRWARDWDHVRYCSAACRAAGLGPVDQDLERAIVDLLEARPGGATICPSEAAQRVAAERGSDAEEAWPPLMERTRWAARRLVAAGEAEITQGGRVVDPSTARGPIRIRRTR